MSSIGSKRTRSWAEKERTGKRRILSVGEGKNEDERDAGGIFFGREERRHRFSHSDDNRPSIFSQTKSPCPASLADTALSDSAADHPVVTAPSSIRCEASPQILGGAELLSSLSDVRSFDLGGGKGEPPPTLPPTPQFSTYITTFTLQTFYLPLRPTLNSSGELLGMEGINCRGFTREEDGRLFGAVERGEGRWSVIGGEVGRTEYECYIRWNKELQPAMGEVVRSKEREMREESMKYQKKSSPKQTLSPLQKVKGAWTKAEDTLILDYVNLHTPPNTTFSQWTALASHLSAQGYNRVGKQTRERYKNLLDPRLNTSGFGEEEDFRLFCLHKRYGSKWVQISKCMDHRSENSLKNRFNSKTFGKKMHEFQRRYDEELQRGQMTDAQGIAYF
ncbi:hypothetical protein TrLO_g8637 [Triparma laevis f. longispina]|uniref:Myb-like domain-containing protein n=1 Tax=Triparma laevis f. longispina TaxID=1714387 RepID=A0A9W7EJ90_9STRA|nr:hypothetical protein TrLO_g8637 [Triparma laevis f. longispina]